jgi:hypothetical protein
MFNSEHSCEVQVLESDPGSALLTALSTGDTLWPKIFNTRPNFLYGAVRVLGSEIVCVRVRILKFSSMSSQFSGSIIRSPL